MMLLHELATQTKPKQIVPLYSHELRPALANSATSPFGLMTPKHPHCRSATPKIDSYNRFSESIRPNTLIAYNKRSGP